MSFLPLLVEREVLCDTEVVLLHNVRDLDLYPFLNRAKIDRLNCGNNGISNHAEMASQHYIYNWIYKTVSIICAKPLI